MDKKILCMSILVLGLIGAAVADNGADANYTSSDSIASTTTYFIPGIYLGGQLGLANLHYSCSKYTKSDSSYDDAYKLAGRAYIGYAFSQYISSELSYDYYGRPKFKHTSGNTQDILQQGLDLVAKANLPLDYGFGIYIKGGLAWVYRSTLNSNAGSFVDKPSNNKITPVGAVGINYWFAPNIALDLCFTKTMTVSDLPTMDLFTVGIIYKINI